MSTLSRLVLVGLLLALPACAPGPGPEEPAPSPPERRPLRLQVLHTNDFHGRLLPQYVDGDSLGGSAVLAAHFDSLRARFDGPTLLLSAGDVMQGTAVSNLTWGRAAIEVYNRKGYDAAAPGNHEFDWGLDTLRARVSESRFPWVAANVVEEETGRPPAWLRPWVVLERGGVRVGVVGVALATTPRIVMPGRVDGLVFQDEAPAIDRAVRRLRAEGVDFVVVTGHVGAVCRDPGTAPEDASAGCEGRLVEIAGSLTEPVDLFVGGHTHLRNLAVAGGVPLVQNPAYSRGFSVTRLERYPGAAVRLTHRSIRAPRRIEVDPDTTLARVVAEWTGALGPLLEAPVAVLADSVTNAARLPVENPAGNLLADAQRWATGTDVALVNNGSLRRSLPAGPLTYGTLYEFQPFQNELVRVGMEGQLLREALEFGLTDDGRPWVHVSGITVEYDPARPRGRRIRRILRDAGGVVEAGDRVSVAVTDFLAAGGDGYRILLEGQREGTGWVDLDALREYLATLPEPVEPPPVGRWRIAPGL